MCHKSCSSSQCKIFHENSDGNLLNSGPKLDPFPSHENNDGNLLNSGSKLEHFPRFKTYSTIFPKYFWDFFPNKYSTSNFCFAMYFLH